MHLIKVLRQLAICLCWAVAIAARAVFARDVTALDVSGSMNESTSSGIRKIDKVLADLKTAAVGSASSDTEIVAFSDGIRWRGVLPSEPSAFDATAMKLRAEVALNRRTALWSTLKIIIEEAKIQAVGEESSATRITVLSDLADNESKPNDEAEVFSALRSAGAERVRLSFVGLGTESFEKLPARIPAALRDRVTVGSTLDLVHVIPPVIEQASTSAVAGKAMAFFVTGWPKETRFEWSVDGASITASGARVDLLLSRGNRVITVVANVGTSTRLKGRKEVFVESPPGRIEIVSQSGKIFVGQDVILTAVGEEVAEPIWKVGDQVVERGWTLHYKVRTPTTFLITVQARRIDGSVAEASRNFVAEFSMAAAAFLAPTEIAAGSKARLTDTSTGDIECWSWSTSDGQLSNEQHPEFVFGKADTNEALTILVKLEIGLRDGRKLRATAQQVRIVPAHRESAPRVAVSIPADPRVGVPTQLSFTSVGGPVAGVEWVIDGESFRQNNPAWTPKKSGHAMLTFTANGPGGRCVAQQELNILPPWRAPILRVHGIPENLVVGLTTTLVAFSEGDATAVEWRTPAGIVAGAKLQITPTQPGVWTASVIAQPADPTQRADVRTIVLTIAKSPSRWRRIGVLFGLCSIAGIALVINYFRKRRTFGTLQLTRGEKTLERSLGSFRQKLDEDFVALDQIAMRGFIRHRPGDGMEMVITSTGDVFDLGYGTSAPVPLGGSGITAMLRL